MSEQAKTETTTTSKKVLLAAVESNERDLLQGLFESQGFEVACRDSRLRSFQLLAITPVSLALVGAKLQDSDGLTFCREFRSEASFQAIPLVMFAESEPDGSLCVAAFEAEVDDFIEMPSIPAVLLARVRRLLRPRARTAAVSSLSVQVTSGELPGVLSFLEAETKTGRLNVTRGGQTVVICLKEGRLVNGAGPNCEGLDAVVEALSWDSSHVTFEEAELSDAECRYSYETTGTIMNCVFEVDEFREARGSMPEKGGLLFPGDKNLPDDTDAAKKKVYEMAVSGHPLNEILGHDELGERKATMALKQLIDDGYITPGLPPFAEFTRRTYEQYVKSGAFFEGRLREIHAVLTQLIFPLPPAPSEGGPTIDWLTPAPKVVITGDNPDHVSRFIKTAAGLSQALHGRQPPTRNVHKGITVSRLYFAERGILDLQTLPPTLDTNVHKSLPEYLMETCGVIFLASAQTRRATANNVRLVRQLRRHFAGVYYLVVPQVANKYDKYEFRMDCEHCGYTLSVDMAMAGSMGECPICNTTLTIPDSLDHLAHGLSLPEDVPIVQIQPDAPKHCRDLIVFLIGSILKACHPPQATADMLDKESSVVLSVTEVRERAKASEIMAAPDESDAESTPVMTETASEAEDNELISQLNAILSPGSGQDNSSDMTDDDDDGDADDFDIDSFIAQVRNLESGE